MNVILLNDVDKLGLKGEVVDVERGYARNFLLPRRLAEVATAGRVAEVQRIEAQSGRGTRRAAAEQADEIAATLGKTSCASRSRPARPVPVRLGHADRHRRRDLADAQDPRRPAQDRPRHDQADRPLQRADRRVRGRLAEVKMLVVPEGGELPPEEELAAMEAAEAERGGSRGGAKQRRTPRGSLDSPRRQSSSRMIPGRRPRGSRRGRRGRRHVEAERSSPPR